MFEFRKRFFNFSKVLLILVAFAAVSISAQSTNIEFPTPISADSISGKINPRDIGDARLTTHYYIFEGNQGDIFLKIEAANLTGDIDIFYADNLRPLTKISLYSDSTSTQTGREIYLRKPEKLILRVEGRTLNDDAATYSVKFEGSFQAMAATEAAVEPKLPEVKTEDESDVRVNSVGTILEVKPKPAPTPKETVARRTRRRGTKATTTPQAVSTAKPTKKAKEKIEKAPEAEKKVEVVITDNLPTTSETKEKEVEKVEAVATEEPKASKKKKKATTTKKRAPVAKKPAEPKTPKPDPAAELAKALENVRLIVEFKDGGKLERPMNDILKFGVDKGVLTIINKDGTVGRYSILDVLKISVE